MNQAPGIGDLPEAHLFDSYVIRVNNAETIANKQNNKRGGARRYADSFYAKIFVAYFALFFSFVTSLRISVSVTIDQAETLFHGISVANQNRQKFFHIILPVLVNKMKLNSKPTRKIPTFHLTKTGGSQNNRCLPVNIGSMWRLSDYLKTYLDNLLIRAIYFFIVATFGGDKYRLYSSHRYRLDYHHIRGL